MLVTQTTQNLIPHLTALKGAPLSVLTVLLHASAPVSQADLARLTGYHRQSIARAITTLQTRQIIALAPGSRGWVVSLPETPSDVQKLTPSPQTLKAVKEEEDLSDLKKQDPLLSDSPVPLQNFVPPGGDDDPAPSVTAMLENSANLLGFPVLGSPGEYPDPWALCAWIACAWHRRKYIRNPAALVHWGTHQNRLPDDSRYLDHPNDFLPRWFLHKIGFPTDPDPDHPASYETPPEYFALDQPVSGSLTPRQAWSLALERVEPEVPTHMFNTWLKYTTLIGFTGSAIEIRANNDVHRENLDAYTDRLGSLLTEILGQRTSVSIWF